MVVVADPILEARGRAGGLDAPDQPFGDENGEGIVDGLERDRPDLRSHDVGDGVSRDVRLSGNGSKDRQPLRGDLNAALPEKICRIGRHQGR
jgi:hypothetical protein